MAKAKIMIVEDDAITAMDIENQLKNLGYGVSAKVAYGEDAIQKAKENTPDLVLMDIVLKGQMDGIEGAEEIHTQFDIPVVFLTAFADKEKIERAKLTMPFGYILKPFQDRDLKITIEMALYIDVNDAVSALYGYSREEFLKLKHTDITAEPEKSDKSIKQTISGEISSVPVRYHKRKDGTTFPVEISSGAFKSGNRQLVFGVVRDITERKQAEEALRESEEKYRSMMEAMVEPAYICTSDFIVSYMNPAMVKRTGRDATGELCHKAINDLDEQCPWCIHDKIQNGENDETIIVSPKDHRLYSISRAPIFHNDSSISKMTIYRDITDIKQTEQRLQEREKELEIKNIRLEEMNAALKVLLKKREEDKTELEDNVLTNVKELVTPYFEKIKKTKLDDQQKDFLSIIETNLNEIVSPFTRKMSLKYLNLTPAEIQIANLIKHGRTTKKIAKLLHISPRTVETHRKNMRRKIGLERKRANLRSYLLSLY